MVFLKARCDALFLFGGRMKFKKFVVSNDFHFDFAKVEFLVVFQETTVCLFSKWNPNLCSPFLERLQTNMSNISSAFILNFGDINKRTKVSADLLH